ncbi:MAG: TetR/AcrR family transcriptional regulator [Pseudomonadota bacterium]
MSVVFERTSQEGCADKGRITKGERTRDAIAEAAIHILYNEGYQALNVAALAEEAGLQRNSYYTHFKDLNALIDTLSVQLLNEIGRNTPPVSAPRKKATSLLISRLRLVLSLRESDPVIAGVLPELYVNHNETARKIHYGLVSDIVVDRRRGLLRATKREAEVAALMIAPSVMEFLRDRQGSKAGDDRILLSLLSRVIGLSD